MAYSQTRRVNGTHFGRDVRWKIPHKIQYTSQIIEDQECNSYRELKRMDGDRVAWKSLQTYR